MEAPGPVQLTIQLRSEAGPELPLCENLPVEAGRNTVRWNATSYGGMPLRAGRYHLLARLTDEDGGHSTARAFVTAERAAAALIYALPSGETLYHRRTEPWFVDCAVTGAGVVHLECYADESLTQRFASIRKKLEGSGRFRIAWNGACDGRKAPAGQYELNEAAFEKMVNINQKGVFLMSQAVARQMVKQHDGVIVNVSSESGLEGSEGQSCYAATKAALNSFTRSWSKELGKHGIRVVGIAPGILEKTGLRTPEYEEALAWTRNITVEQLREGYTKNAIPIGRAGRLAEVADFVCYLLSERASYITGVTTNIAGGKTRG